MRAQGDLASHTLLFGGCLCRTWYKKGWRRNGHEYKTGLRGGRRMRNERTFSGLFHSWARNGSQTP
eukprot:3711808-Karenia_brevis.AAC.1